MGVIERVTRDPANRQISLVLEPESGITEYLVYRIGSKDDPHAPRRRIKAAEEWMTQRLAVRHPRG